MTKQGKTQEYVGTKKKQQNKKKITIQLEKITRKHWRKKED